MYRRLLLGYLLILALIPTRADAAGPHEPGHAPSVQRVSVHPQTGVREALTQERFARYAKPTDSQLMPVLTGP